MISLILGQTADFISPLYIGRITTVIEKGEFDKVGPIVWELFAIVFVAGIFVGIRARTFNAMSEKIALSLRRDYYTIVLNKDIEFFEANRTGELLSRLNSDVAVI